MEKKTKKRIFIESIGVIAGVLMFGAAIKFSFPIIGLIGFVIISTGLVEVIYNICKGIEQKIEFNKFWKERQLSIKRQHKNIEVRPYDKPLDNTNEQLLDKNTCSNSKRFRKFDEHIR